MQLTYPYTLEYQKAYEHWRLSLEGDMRADDEPLQLLQAAIDRTRAESGRKRAKKRKMTKDGRSEKTKKTTKRK
jgi:hypothetical protein